MIKTIVRKDGVERVDMTQAEEAAFVADSEVQRLAGLQNELTKLQLEFATKGMKWLVKLLRDNGTVPAGNIPTKFINAVIRIEEIEAELTQ